MLTDISTNYGTLIMFNNSCISLGSTVFDSIARVVQMRLTVFFFYSISHDGNGITPNQTENIFSSEK